MKSPSLGFVGLLLLAVSGSVAAADPPSGVLKEAPISESQFVPWGNLQGMRVRGEWVPFEAGVRVVRSDWSGFSGAVEYLQRPEYSRAGNQRTVVSSIDGVGFRNVLTDTAPGEATFEVEVVAETELEAAAVFFCLDLPGEGFSGATVQVFDSDGATGTTLTPSSGPEAREVTGRRIRIAGGRHRLDLEVAGSVEVRLRRDLFNRATALNDPRVDQPFEQPEPGKQSDWQLYLTLLDGAAPRGARAAMRIDLKATAAIDAAPVRLILDATKPGRRFDGVGGNFRLQFPKTDPAVIQYCLENLPLTWGRNDLPWAEWHPVEDEDPLALARSGKLHPRVSAAMDMARTLEKRGIPMIVSVWSVPRWARADHQPPGLRGIALHEGKQSAIADSLAKALVFLKEQYGVEAAFFSLNEPETGVEVRQTAIEHREFMLAMGRELAKHNLATRMLLGDTAHGTPAAHHGLLRAQGGRGLLGTGSPGADPTVLESQTVGPDAAPRVCFAPDIGSAGSDERSVR